MIFDINQLAREKLLRVYDTALPQDWVDDVYKRTGFHPQEYGFVWSYDNAKIFGEAVALTPAATVLLVCYRRMIANDR